MREGLGPPLRGARRSRFRCNASPWREAATFPAGERATASRPLSPSPAPARWAKRTGARGVPPRTRSRRWDATAAGGTSEPVLSPSREVGEFVAIGKGLLEGAQRGRAFEEGIGLAVGRTTPKRGRRTGWSARRMGRAVTAMIVRRAPEGVVDGRKQAIEQSGKCGHRKGPGLLIRRPPRGDVVERKGHAARRTPAPVPCSHGRDMETGRPGCPLRRVHVNARHPERTDGGGLRRPPKPSVARGNVLPPTRP